MKRRTRKNRLNWQKFNKLLKVYPLPTPKIHQPWYGVAE
jgi:hypothetical protein